MKYLSFFFFVITTVSFGQIKDKSKTHKTIKIKPVSSVFLSDSIAETSSLVFFDNLLWTTNDDSDPTLYGMDTNGSIKKKITIEGLKNKEWEEITQDNEYLYLGDFGNNYKGNRRDLRILKIEKKALQTAKPKIDTIAFTYADQTNFEVEKPNKTNFDCEAFITLKDSLYLFTKRYKDGKTSVYSLPKTPGKQLAKLIQTYNIKGLVTGASYFEEKNKIALSGYNKYLKPFVMLLDGFENYHFFDGRKQKIKLKLCFQQIESICTTDGLHYFLTNEKFSRKPFINHLQQLYYLDLSGF